jgi:photosystem II stability/assembly factor-like uncharacterized protein
MVDNLPNPKPTPTPRHCVDSVTREYKQVAEELSPAAQPAFNITSYEGPAANFLERVKDDGCPFNLYVVVSKCDSKQVFGNRERAWVYRRARLTDDVVVNPVQRETGTLLDHTWAVTGWIGRIDHRPLTVARIATSETAALNHITAAAQRCAGACGARRGKCEVMTASADTVAAAIPDVFLSTDTGATWTSPASGFAAGTNVNSGKILQIDTNTERYIYVRGTLAATPLQVEYSDDATATWTQVDVGSTNAEATVGGGSMFFVPGTTIGYICTDGGRVYKSLDGGASWAEQTTALSASGATSLSAIHFCDENVGYAVGATDVIIGTVDGGVNWTAQTATGSGDTLNTVCVFSENRLIVGTNNGVAAAVPLYMSFDGTTTWEVKSTGLSAAATDTIECVTFLPDGLTGFLLKNTAAPVGRVYKSIDGGDSWVAENTVTNSGMNWLNICHSNQAFLVGEVNAATSFIASVSG